MVPPRHRADGLGRSILIALSVPTVTRKLLSATAVNPAMAAARRPHALRRLKQHEAKENNNARFECLLELPSGGLVLGFLR